MYGPIQSLIDQARGELQQGRTQSASALLTRALKAQPRDFDALHLMGLTQTMQGDTQAGIASFRKALSVKSSDYRLQFNLAKALSETGQDSEALKCHRKATQLDPSQPQAWLNLGQCLGRLQRTDEALAAYDRALAVAPQYAAAWNNKGLALQALRRQVSALEAIDQAIQFQPDMAEAHFNRGNVLDTLGRYSEALTSYARALDLKPDYTEAMNNQGTVLAELERLEEALTCYEWVLARHPNHARAWYNKGNALLALTGPEQAEACYTEAARIDPNYPDAQYALGLMLLARGQFAEGWAKTEFRWQSMQASQVKVSMSRPRWGGSPSDRPLLLWGEQGPGDQILYSSVLPELADLPQRKMVALDRRLIPLFGRSMPGFEFVDLAQASDALDFAEHLPLGSLPRLLRPDTASFQRARSPFLRADESRTAALRGKIARPGKLSCGVSWWSNRKSIGRYKSLSLAQLLAPLASDKLHFVNLQYGDTAAERETLLRDLHIEVQNVEEVDNFNDLDGLAALIQACDVIITTSNTTAHLAGALGKKTLLLLPSGKGRLWYWSGQNEQNLWYPSIRSFEQSEPGDWRNPLANIKRYLDRKVWN